MSLCTVLEHFPMTRMVINSSVREENNPPPLSEFLAETSLREDRLMRKTRRNLLTCVPHVYMGDAQGKLSNSLRWLRIQA